MRDTAGFHTMLGFAAKAKKLVAGDENTEALLKKRKVKLLIVADDLAENRRKYWENVGAQCEIDVIVGTDKLSMGLAMGMSPRGIVAVCDENFALVIKQRAMT